MPRQPRWAWNFGPPSPQWPTPPRFPGRLERVRAKRNFQVFVDYAHTEDALRNVLRTLRELAPNRLITVFGCGGDRDRTKRPLMAAASEEFSDWSILTSDNPRTEDPAQILSEVRAGLRTNRYEEIPDRTEAIRKAVTLALPGDIVLIAGKGHETYQEFADGKIPFDDSAVARRAIEEKRVEIEEEDDRRRPFPIQSAEGALIVDALTLFEIADMCGGILQAASSGGTVRRISKDTRTLVPGDLYLALHGESHDGNIYAKSRSGTRRSRRHPRRRAR